MGGYHVVALRDDGTVVAWGSNNDGGCVVPAILNDCTQIAAGGSHNLAIQGDGTVVAWGNNSSGQCGTCDEVQDPYDPPCGDTNSLYGAYWIKTILVDEEAEPLEAIAVSAGLFHSLAIKTDGSLIAWGAGEDENDANFPEHNYGQTSVPSGTYTHIAAGGFHSVAIKTDGTVVAWGAGSEGDMEFPTDPHYGQSIVPEGLGTCTQIAAGWYHTLALKADGTVAAWGDNSFGQCNVPSELGTCVAIAAGDWHSVAIRTDGTVYVWGRNKFYSWWAIGGTLDEQYLADGTKDDSSLAENSVAGKYWVKASLGTCRALAAGGIHTVVLESCLSDVDRSGEVDTGDLGLLLLNFGPCDCGSPFDLDGSGEVDTADLGLLLLNFGPCQ
jgi:alpha-tubulin suppressor-like RCC1 family protein